jgi:hypothetical protein
MFKNCRNYRPPHRCAECRHPLVMHLNFGRCTGCLCMAYVKSLRAKVRETAKKLCLRRSKTRTNYKARLWDVFSKYVRLSYADAQGMVACVTCDAVAHWKEMDAGHYHPRTDGLALYFDLRNVHPQCTSCNRFRRGNLTRYALFLQKTYGPNILMELDEKRRLFAKISEPEYLALIAEYQGKLKQRGEA